MVSLSIGLSVTIVSPAKTAEPVDIPFGDLRPVGPRNHVLVGGAHWRNLAYTTEPSVCGDDVALRQTSASVKY